MCFGDIGPFSHITFLPVCCVAVESKEWGDPKKSFASNLSDFFPQISKSTLLKSTVVMKVYDFNRFSKHEIIGELRVQLCNVDWNHVIEEWQDLAEPAKFEVEEQN